MLKKKKTTASDKLVLVKSVRRHWTSGFHNEDTIFTQLLTQYLRKINTIFMHLPYTYEGVVARG